MKAACGCQNGQNIPLVFAGRGWDTVTQQFDQDVEVQEST